MGSEGENPSLPWPFVKTAKWPFDKRGVTGDTGQGATGESLEILILNQTFRAG